VSSDFESLGKKGEERLSPPIRHIEV